MSLALPAKGTVSPQGIFCSDHLQVSPWRNCWFAVAGVICRVPTCQAVSWYNCS